MASGHQSIKGGRYTPPTNAPKHLKLACKYIGTHEWVMDDGDKVSNPLVQDWIEKAGGGANKNTVRTPWCAYFHDAMLLEAGLGALKSGLARAHLKWGMAVEEDDWRVGDTVIFLRLVQGKDNGINGHIAFLLEWDDDTVTVVGGNQGDRVSVAVYRRETILGVRRSRSVSSSRTIQKAVGSVVAETSSQVADKAIPTWVQKGDQVKGALEEIQSPLEMLSAYKPWIVGVLSAIAIGLALWAAYHRFADFKEGKNA